MQEPKRSAGAMTIDAPAAVAPFGRWIERHALLINLLVGSALFLYDSMYLIGQYVGFGVLSLPEFVVIEVLSALICAAYVVRRRAPLVFTVVAVVASCGYIVLGVGISPAPLVLLWFMLYSLAALRGWSFAVPAALAVAVWVVAASQPLLAKEYLRIGEAGMLAMVAVFAVLLGLFARARRRHVEGLRALNEHLVRERDARALVAAAEERARIAREIHDIVSHSLGTMVVMADGATQTVGSEPEQAGAAMARVRDTGREAMGEMRRMLDVLRSDDPAMRAPQPGLARLDRLIEESRSTGLRVDLRVEGAPVVLPSGLDLAAYRIVQESLTNARKHGGSLLSLVSVTIRYRVDGVEVQVVDDGRELDCASSTSADAGHGLVGMRERVTAYGGTLEAGPRAAGGFEVRAVLPIGGAE